MRACPESARRVQDRHGRLCAGALPRQGPQDGGELPPVCQQRLLQRHDLPPRDRRVHDPGRRPRPRHEAEDDAWTDRERGGNGEQGWPEERARNDRHGAYLGAELGDGPVLHQCEGQRLSRLSRPLAARHRLRGLRAGSRRNEHGAGNLQSRDHDGCRESECAPEADSHPVGHRHIGQKNPWSDCTRITA